MRHSHRAPSGGEAIRQRQAVADPKAACGEGVSHAPRTRARKKSPNRLIHLRGEGGEKGGEYAASGKRFAVNDLGTGRNRQPPENLCCGKKKRKTKNFDKAGKRWRVRTRESKPATRWVGGRESSAGDSPIKEKG